MKDTFYSKIDYSKPFIYRGFENLSIQEIKEKRQNKLESTLNTYKVARIEQDRQEKLRIQREMEIKRQRELEEKRKREAEQRRLAEIKRKEEQRKKQQVEVSRGERSNHQTVKAVVTFYTANYESTGKTSSHPDYGKTASGEMVQSGVTAACPPHVKLGTWIIIEDVGKRKCTDRGGEIKGNRYDVYVRDVSTAMKLGKRNLEVIIIGE
ncbi:3D domain-containing protein [Metabacillus fastidiosus]|uniref:3D domain-containing protein n=1 Tax=Metabacillus fastidiosus TaxID=1458 RepID=UPI003D267944